MDKILRRLRSMSEEQIDEQIRIKEQKRNDEYYLSYFSPIRPVKRDSGDYDGPPGCSYLGTTGYDRSGCSYDGLNKCIEKKMQEIFKNFSLQCNLFFEKDLKLTEVRIVDYKFQKNVPLTECEKKLGFDKLSFKEVPRVFKKVPMVLNILRNLALLIDTIQKTCIKDYNFFGNWTIKTKNSQVNYKFAQETIRNMFSNAKILLDLYVKPKSNSEEEEEGGKGGNLSWNTYIFEKSKNDIMFDTKTIDNSEEDDDDENLMHAQRHISVSVHDDMIKFIIAVFFLNHVMDDIIISREFEPIPPSIEDRVRLIQEHLSIVLYNLYRNYFDSNYDERGRMIMPKF